MLNPTIYIPYLHLGYYVNRISCTATEPPKPPVVEHNIQSVIVYPSLTSVLKIILKFVLSKNGVRLENWVFTEVVQPVSLSEHEFKGHKAEFEWKNTSLYSS